MFDIGYSELLLIAVVALVVIGPKDLPRVMRTVGGWVGKGRAMTRHVRAGFDTMMREAELDEMQKQWAQQNAEIMRAAPSLDASGDRMAVTYASTPDATVAQPDDVAPLIAAAAPPSIEATPPAATTTKSKPRTRAPAKPRVKASDA